MGPPPGAAKAEAARLAAMASSDPEGLARAELNLIASLLRSQFGPATISEEHMAVELLVGWVAGWMGGWVVSKGLRFRV